MFKLLKILKQIVSQLEQMCLKLGLKNCHTLAILNMVLLQSARVDKSTIWYYKNKSM